MANQVKGLTYEYAARSLLDFHKPWWTQKGNRFVPCSFQVEEEIMSLFRAESEWADRACRCCNVLNRGRERPSYLNRVPCLIAPGNQKCLTCITFNMDCLDYYPPSILRLERSDDPTSKRTFESTLREPSGHNESSQRYFHTATSTEPSGADAGNVPPKHHESGISDINALMGLNKTKIGPQQNEKPSQTNSTSGTVPQKKIKLETLDTTTCGEGDNSEVEGAVGSAKQTVSCTNPPQVSNPADEKTKSDDLKLSELQKQVSTLQQMMNGLKERTESYESTQAVQNALQCIVISQANLTTTHNELKVTQEILKRKREEIDDLRRENAHLRRKLVEGNERAMTTGEQKAEPVQAKIV